jgi:hypothetical protein
VTADRLLLGAPDDPAERAAHRAAHRVVAGGTATVRPITARPRGAAVDPLVQRRITRAYPTGRPLPDADRTAMERAFGADLGEVRLHTGAEAGALCRALDARAFTVDRHVFVGEEYRPGTDEARRLLAHELAHVLQRQSGVVRRVVTRMGVGQKVIVMDEQAVLERVQGADGGQLYAAAQQANVDLPTLIKAHVDAQQVYTLLNVYDEIRRQVARSAFQDDFGLNISGLGLQSKILGSDNVSQQFQAVETPDQLDVHPGQIIFRATVAAQLGSDDNGVHQAGKWTLGIVQNVLSAYRVVTFARQDQSTRTVTMTVASQTSDRRDDNVTPWYDPYRSSHALNLDYQEADVLLDDQPGFTLAKGADEWLHDMQGTDYFRTWLVLRRNADGAMTFLYSWDWQIDYAADGGTVTPGAEGWFPDGSDAVLTGPRASQAAAVTDVVTPAQHDNCLDNCCTII